MVYSNINGISKQQLYHSIVWSTNLIWKWFVIQTIDLLRILTMYRRKETNDETEKLNNKMAKVYVADAIGYAYTYRR